MSFLSKAFKVIANVFTLGAYGAVSKALKKALKAPQAPAIPEQPKIVTEQDPVILAAQQDERRRQRMMAGRQSTILAPLIPQNSTAFKTTLGG